MQTVRELAEQVDPSLVLELYAVAQGSAPQHKGTYNLDNPSSLADLLQEYGEQAVVSYQEYKVYLLAYIAPPAET